MSYSKFDLTFKIGQYLDRHLVFPLLEFLAAKDVGYELNFTINSGIQHVI